MKKPSKLFEGENKGSIEERLDVIIGGVYPTIEKAYKEVTNNDGWAKQFRLLILNFISQVAKEEREKIANICRKIYIDGADWSEWGATDEEAGQDFDEALHKVTSEEKQSE